MPSPTTALDLIKGAMRSVNIISTGETPTADESTDALSSLNDLLELMSTENLFVYGQANETFNTVVGQATYTIGPAGNFNTARPVRIANAYCTYGGVDFPIDIIGPMQFDLIPLKSQQQQIIEQLLYVNDNPLGLISLWPTPAAVVPLTLSTDRVLTQIPTLATALVYPPGYLLYMRNQLAIMLAPDYGITPSASVMEDARTAKAAVKRANKIKTTALFDIALCDGAPFTWQMGL